MGKVERVKKRVDKLRSKDKNKRADRIESRLLTSDANTKLLGNMGGEIDLAMEAEETLLTQGKNKDTKVGLPKKNMGGRVSNGSMTYSK
tara:strand:- start:1107 stop:1373 length:267 start_codon:yes stop_codon:yes gene_type:complete